MVAELIKYYFPSWVNIEKSIVFRPAPASSSGRSAQLSDGQQYSAEINQLGSFEPVKAQGHADHLVNQIKFFH